MRAAMALATWVVRRVRRREPRRYYAGAIAILLTSLYLGAGWAAAHRIRETDYTVETQKATDPLRVVLMADAHLGVTLDGDGFTATMARIEALRPDVVVMVGDYVDDDSTRADMLAASRALGALETTYGVYFVFGNHDRGYYNSRDFSAEDLENTLLKNGIHILEDESALIDDRFYLVGRADKGYNLDRLTMDELLQDVDTSKYIIVMDHEPADYDAEAQSAADLVLCGHTHGGQMFPLTKCGVWSGIDDSTYGLEEHNNTNFIVSSGISDWAIKFKTGTRSEYVVVNLSSEK